MLPDLPRAPDLTVMVGGGLAALLTLALLAWASRTLARTRRVPRPDRSETSSRAVPRARLEDVTTVLAACLATGVAATGMWKFFGDVLDLKTPLKVLLFAFVEVAMVTSALRARRNVRESATHSAGIDGVAVWVFTLLSAVLAASDADGVRQALIRLAAPLVAAWLWERGLAADRRHATGHTTRIHWRLTPERLLVRLGLAEPTGRTASDVDVHRRIARLAKAAKKVRVLRASQAKPRVLARALARLDKAMDAAVEHAHLATAPVRQQELLAQIALLYHAVDLADLAVDTPWHSAPARPVATAGSVLPPLAERTRSEEELVALGFESAKVQTYLADKFGLELATGDITGSLAHTSGATPTAALRSRLGLPPATASDPNPVAGPMPAPTRDLSPDPVSDPPSGQVSPSGPDRSADTVQPADNTPTSDAGKEVSDPPALPKPGPAPKTGSKTGGKARSKAAKVSPVERIDQARELDARYRAEHGRHIPAEKLSRAMRIGKPAALGLVRQIRDDHANTAA
ncbi:hypothetical protein [Actinomadura hibisca]|uniref:hypothetical protein n=1 Tax=Actinomadura hibisca TaxID=68565 RepID=UPI0008339A49|nr:hypothetical protein [Actinomadura hibisca]